MGMKIDGIYICKGPFLVGKSLEGKRRKTNNHIYTERSTIEVLGMCIFATSDCQRAYAFQPTSFCAGDGAILCQSLQHWISICRYQRNLWTGLLLVGHWFQMGQLLASTKNFRQKVKAIWCSRSRKTTPDRYVFEVHDQSTCCTRSASCSSPWASRLGTFVGLLFQRLYFPESFFSSFMVLEIPS